MFVHAGTPRTVAHRLRLLCDGIPVLIRLAPGAKQASQLW
jgi:hypothetical protein